MFKLPRVKITNIDRHAFQGRQWHPSKSDVGLEGQVVRVDTEYAGPDGTAGCTAYVHDPDEPDRAKKAAWRCARSMRAPDLNASAVHVLYVWMDEGFLLQLVDSEVEVIGG